ncbi:MAG: hypothetical protein E6772_10950 [Dysgonomonas sp.]|nr:hypothetical protein [Dysgonomonas sp.]
MKEKVAILIRVYDRIEDLKYNLQIIRDTWTEFDYHIIVVSNGYPNGYKIDDESISKIDTFIVLEQNAGHKKGNSQLLLEGRKAIPTDCDYTIILEADTWVYKDGIVKKYIRLMQDNPNLVWCSADWYDKDYSLATDFAIIRSEFIRKNEGLFDFGSYPESHIANYLRDAGGQFRWITENMPVHVPAYMPRYPYVDDSVNRRFYIFPKSRMVTHHIEYVKGGMNKKKQYFNIVSDTDYFPEQQVSGKAWKRFKINFWIKSSSLLIKKSWFKKKYYRNITE